MNAKDISKTLDILQTLNDALATPNTLLEGMRKIVELTCQLLDTEQAAFLQMDDENHRFIIQVACGLHSDTFKEGQPLQVPDRINDILWRLQNLHQIKRLESDIKELKFPITAMPIFLRGRRIGHLIAAGARDQSKAVDPMRRKIFALLGPFASLIVENAKATDLINRQFTLRSKELLSSMEKESASSAPTDALMINTIRNPGKIVRLLSESFYRELTSAGFSTPHVIMAATHLLECINNNGNANNQE